LIIVLFDHGPLNSFKRSTREKAVRRALHKCHGDHVTNFDLPSMC